MNARRVFFVGRVVVLLFLSALSFEAFLAHPLRALAEAAHDLAVYAPEQAVTGTATPRRTATSARTLAPTRTPSPTRTATNTRTPSPTRTYTPTRAPTLAPSATAARTVELDEVFELLLAQVSLQVSGTVASAERQIDVEVTYVFSPRSMAVKRTEQHESNYYVNVGPRDWWRSDSSPRWVSVKDNPQAKPVAETMRTLGGSTIFSPVRRGVRARLTQTGQRLDGTLCHMYEWADDKDSGTICLAVQTGLPVRATMKLAEFALDVSYFNYNAPKNIIRPPAPETSPVLFIDDAHMALNALTNFQWSTSLQSKEAGDTLTWQIKGTYVLADPGWYALVWANRTSGQPGNRLLQKGRQRWSARGSDDADWRAAPPFERDSDKTDEFTEPAPFFPWELVWHVAEQPGALGSRGSKSFQGQSADEYGFSVEFKDQSGQAYKQAVRVYIVPESGLPIYLEIKNSGADLDVTIVWELVAANDPLIVLPSVPSGR